VPARPDSGRWHGGVTGKAEGGEVGGGQRKEEGGIGDPRWWTKRHHIVRKTESSSEEKKFENGRNICIKLEVFL
jgi:hypothetical protein